LSAGLEIEGVRDLETLKISDPMID